MVVYSTSKLLQNSRTRLPQLMNTSGFHQNVGEGNKSLNGMSPDPFLSEAFGKGSGCARLVKHWTCADGYELLNENVEVMVLSQLKSAKQSGKGFIP